ncbi:ECF transporter S component [Flavonifractor sp. An100]|uniref:ECF transporter S component n=1 Tax=Flavonifractor sp. An100 TaxID=1965538 RepID=UPI000B36758F|nr:ECF transporter S component [Flavonifractor sp. An100]
MSVPTPSVTRTTARSKIDTKTIVSLAMLTAIAYIVMLLSKLMPSVMFLDFDFKDVVICIGGFTFGPMAAAIISILVAFIEMITISTTGIIGFIMNALATCAFCCTASFVYKKLHTKKGAVLGLGLGVVCLVVVMLLWNYLITPLYMTGYTRADVAALLPTLFFPFNLAKGGMNMAATLLLYAPVVTAMRKAGVVPPSQSSQEKKINAGFVLFSLALLATFVLFALVLAGVI